MRALKTHPLLSVINNLVVDLPSPTNLSYLWGFGSLLGMTLVIQLATGVFLAMHYTASIETAFISVEHIMRDVNSGWLLRYLHANGASLFFVLVYLHIARGMYYGSYTAPRTLLWSIGVVIFIVMMATAFLGYTLPWGSMSLWGATVITNLFSAIPILGGDLVEWLWGGYSVSQPTLNRFFSLHYVLPFVLAALICIHLMALHLHGSNNPIGVASDEDKTNFHPYYSVKDLFGFAVTLIFLSLFVFFAPNLLGHSDNYIPANPLVTPTHITPEWYFLFTYTVLRSIPNKLMGVIGMFAALVVLFALPALHTSKIRGLTFRPAGKIAFWFFVGIFIALTYMGAASPSAPWITLGQITSSLYFLYFLVAMPALGVFENKLLKL